MLRERKGRKQFPQFFFPLKNTQEKQACFSILKKSHSRSQVITVVRKMRKYINDQGAKVKPISKEHNKVWTRP